MLWWLTETTVVAGALALLAGLLARFKPLGVGPAARHALWLVVLVKLVTPPLVRAPWAFEVPAVPIVAVVETGAESSLVETAEPWPSAAGASTFEARFARRLHLNLRRSAGNTPARAASDTAEAAENGIEPLDETRLVVLDSTRDAATAPATRAIGPWSGLSLGSGSGSWLRLDPRWLERANRGLLAAWVTAALWMGLVQGVRIARFVRRLRAARPAPEWLLDEVDDLAAHLGVRPPAARVVPGIGVPMLWCLGRPTLLLPAHLVKTMGVDRWRGVIAHELAHLRRGDPWVGRLALLAGIAWWWNPIYWIARRRIDAEAELACDAWVVWALPGDRVVYAGTMLEICESLCHKAAPPLAPALGGGGAGRFIERRLTMILNDRVPCRLTWHGLIAPGLLVVAGLPTWTATGAIMLDDPPREARIVITPAKPESVGKKATAHTVLVAPHEGHETQSRHVIVLTPGGTANVDGKTFVVSPDGKATVNGKVIAGKTVMDGKTILVTPMEGDGQKFHIVVSHDGKEDPHAGAAGGNAAALKAKADAARAEAMKHVEAMRARARAQVDQSRAEVDKAADALKRAKAELKEAESSKNEKAEDQAEKAVDKASAALKDALKKLETAEAAAKKPVRIEVRAEVHSSSDAKAKAEADARAGASASANAEGDRPGRREVRRRMEIRRHVGPDGKEMVEVKEIPEGTDDAKASTGGKPKEERRVEVRVVPHDGGKDGASIHKEIEVQVRDLSKMFGPNSDFIKGIETLGPELEKGLREALGPGTEFDSKMKELGTKLGKELKENLGPGSDFDKAMKELAKTLEKQLGPNSEFHKHLKDLTGELEARVETKTKDGDKAARPEARESRPGRPNAEAARERLRERVQERQRGRDREIQELETRIKQLQEQLEKAKKDVRDRD